MAAAITGLVALVLLGAIAWVVLSYFFGGHEKNDVGGWYAVPPPDDEDPNGFAGYQKDEFPNAYYDDTWDMDDDGHTG